MTTLGIFVIPYEELLKFLGKIEFAIAHATIHLVMDNYATHKTPAMKR